MLLFIFVQYGRTALMKAVEHNHPDIVELLLKAGVDMDFKTSVSVHMS